MRPDLFETEGYHVKIILLGILFSLFSLPSWAENPFWLKDKTDQQYQITVYRSATCGCCKDWIAHLREHNFEVTDSTVDDLQKYKQQLGVPREAASCHTASVNGVTIEGHVPAQDIKRLLSSPGDIRLLAAPGMPSGSPGMDTGDAPKQAFNIYSLDKAGQVSIFNSYTDY